VPRILDKLCIRLCQNSEIIDDYDRQFASGISLIDPLDRLFDIIHEIIHNRIIFQRSITKILIFMNQISLALDGKPTHTYVQIFLLF
jgi:hypothetical protein